MILPEKSATFRHHALMLDRRAAPVLEGQPNRYPAAAQTQSHVTPRLPRFVPPSWREPGRRLLGWHRFWRRFWRLAGACSRRAIADSSPVGPGIGKIRLLDSEVHEWLPFYDEILRRCYPAVHWHFAAALQGCFRKESGSKGR
jgi:hypothetical protein